MESIFTIVVLGIWVLFGFWMVGSNIHRKKLKEKEHFSLEARHQDVSIPKGVNVLHLSKNDESSAFRLVCLECLEQKYENHPMVKAAFQSALHDSEPMNRFAGALKAPDEDSYPVLYDLAKSCHHRHVKISAIHELSTANFNVHREEILELFTHLFACSDIEVSIAILKGFVELDSLPPTDDLEQFFQKLQHESPSIFAELLRYHPKHGEAEQFLVNLISTRGTELDFVVLESLTHVGGKDSLGVLAKLSRNLDIPHTFQKASKKAMESIQQRIGHEGGLSFPDEGDKMGQLSINQEKN